MRSSVAGRVVRFGAVPLALFAAVAGCSSSSPSGSGATTRGGGSPTGPAPATSSAPNPSPPSASQPGTPAPPGSSHLVGYDLKQHRIDVFNDKYDVVRHFAAPALKSAFPVAGPSDTFVLTGADGNAVVDLHTGKATPFTLPSSDEIPQYGPADAKVLTFTDAEERVSVLNLTTGEVSEGSTILGDPKAFLSGGVSFPDATTFSDVSGAGITTLVVPYDGATPYAVPGRILALDGSTALTAASTDPSHTRIAVVTGSTEKGSLNVAGDVRGGLLTGPTTATLVTADGRVVSADLAHATTAPLAALGGTDQVVIPVSADRLVVGQPDDPEPTRLVDDQGHVVATFAPVGGQAVWFGLGHLEVGARCFVTQAGSKPVVSGGNVTLRETETGAVRARLSGSAILLRTPDGCSALNNLGSDGDVALDGTVHRFPPFSSVEAVAPDLTAVVVSGRPGSGSPTGWAAVDVATGTRTTLPQGVYTWVSGAS